MKFSVCILLVSSIALAEPASVAISKGFAKIFAKPEAIKASNDNLTLNSDIKLEQAKPAADGMEIPLYKFRKDDMKLDLNAKRYDLDIPLKNSSGTCHLSVALPKDAKKTDTVTLGSGVNFESSLEKIDYYVTPDMVSFPIFMRSFTVTRDKNKIGDAILYCPNFSGKGSRNESLVNEAIAKAGLSGKLNFTTSAKEESTKPATAPTNQRVGDPATKK